MLMRGHARKRLQQLIPFQFHRPTSKPIRKQRIPDSMDMKDSPSIRIVPINHPMQKRLRRRLPTIRRSGPSQHIALQINLQQIRRHNRAFIKPTGSNKNPASLRIAKTEVPRSSRHPTPRRTAFRRSTKLLSLPQKPFRPTHLSHKSANLKFRLVTLKAHSLKPNPICGKSTTREFLY